MRKCNVVLNGEHYHSDIDLSLYTVVADGGYNMLNGALVDVFLGDGDSVNTKDIKARETISLNPKKDMTDGEFAMDFAMDKGYDYINLYGVDGGRLDHILSNLALFGRAEERGVKVVGRCNSYDIYMTSDDEVFEIEKVKDKTISLVPFDNTSHIIDMEGLYYSVSDFDLSKSASRGMSNVASSDRVKIRFGKGRCFIFVLS